MSSKAMSLKARIRNYAKDNRIAAQVVLQNYMFECFLARFTMPIFLELPRYLTNSYLKKL